MIHIAWLSVYDTVRDHPKTRRLARELGVGRHEAIGILVCLWLWGLDNADRDGLILNASAEDIADGAMYRGASAGQSTGQSARQLVDCLIVSGWIDAEGELYRLHDWDTWQAEWYKGKDRRAAGAARKRAERAAKRPKDSPQDSPRERPLHHITIHNTTSELPKGSPDKQCFAKDSEAYRCAKYLDEEICRRLPSRKPSTESALQKWALSFDRLHRIDGQDWQDISDVLGFSQFDDFWQRNILSADTFRRQFFKLMAKCEVQNAG